MRHIPDHIIRCLAADLSFAAAQQIGSEAGDASMLAAGRTEWMNEDYQVAAAARDARLALDAAFSAEALAQQDQRAAFKAFQTAAVGAPRVQAREAYDMACQNLADASGRVQVLSAASRQQRQAA